MVASVLLIIGMEDAAAGSAAAGGDGASSVSVRPRLSVQYLLVSLFWCVRARSRTTTSTSDYDGEKVGNPTTLVDTEPI